MYMTVSSIHSYSTTIWSGFPRKMYYIKYRCKHCFVTDGSTPALDVSTRNVMLNNAQARGLWVIAIVYGCGSIDFPRHDSAQPRHPHNRHWCRGPQCLMRTRSIWSFPTQGICGCYRLAPEQRGKLL
ncbi:hypothetical protein EDB19DRAFT_1701284 [Suillus lakei]|nr:hypothetical protein EDB19DRAFT_1701284 [Suillus lakei]